MSYRQLLDVSSPLSSITVYSLVILPQKKDLSSIKFYTQVDITFSQKESFFTNSSLQGETIPDKEEMSEEFLDLLYLSLSPHNIIL